MCVCVCIYIYILFLSLSLSLSLQLACTASLESVEKCVSGKEERKMEKEHVEDLFFFEIFFLFPPRKNTPPLSLPFIFTRENKGDKTTRTNYVSLPRVLVRLFCWTAQHLCSCTRTLFLSPSLFLCRALSF